MTADRRRAKPSSSEQGAFPLRIGDIAGPEDLPSSLFLGIRDDQSFRRKPEHLECLYRFGDLLYLRIEAEHRGWTLTRHRPEGSVQSVTFGAETLGAALNHF